MPALREISEDHNDGWRLHRLSRWNRAGVFDRPVLTETSADDTTACSTPVKQFRGVGQNSRLDKFLRFGITPLFLKPTLSIPYCATTHSHIYDLNLAKAKKTAK